MFKSGSRKTVLLAAAIFYFTLTASFHFLHTETTVTGGSDCPACQFNNSNASPIPFAAFELPPPSFLDWAPVQEALSAGVTPDILLCPRAPPAG
ncbi:MAG: hypothetical protein A2Y86_09325 [Candidatus Aminicenantes bacterium RBG_13_62_12]|nr:MAG: hypothetical protein A2Y86_09325 [Candidatus Aminicenantes bacterium RBG_13_62_12]